MAQTIHLVFILLILTGSYPVRIICYRFNNHPAYFSSEESFGMSSESLEEGYGGWSRLMSNRFYYEQFTVYAIVNEDYIRSLSRFGNGHSLFGMRTHLFGTFAGVKYYITRETPTLTGSTIFPGAVLMSETRLKEFYDSGKAPRRLPILFVGRRRYEDVFLIDKSYLNPSNGNLGSKTTSSTPTARTTQSGWGHAATVPSRNGGIPGRDHGDISKFFNG